MHRAAPTHKELTAKGGSQPAYADTPPARALNRPPSPPKLCYSVLTNDVPALGPTKATQHAPCTASPPTQRKHDNTARPPASAQRKPPPRTTDPATPETPRPKQRHPGSTDTTATRPPDSTAPPPANTQRKSPPRTTNPAPPETPHPKQRHPGNTSTTTIHATPTQRVAGWSASFDSYVRPPRPGHAPQRVPHADRQRPRPDQPGTPNPRSLAFLTVATCATAASAAADADHPPDTYAWAADTTTSADKPARATDAPADPATDTPPIQHASVLSVAAAVPTSSPLAIEMTAAPSRSHRRGKPTRQMVNFDGCSGASFGERKWLTSTGCKIQRADATLHFHGFCDGTGAANTSQWVADVVLSCGSYTNTHRVWVVENSPCVCLIGRDNMVTSKGFGTTLRPCPENPTVTFDDHITVNAHTDAQPGPAQVHAVATATQLSTAEGCTTGCVQHVLELYNCSPRV